MIDLIGPKEWAAAQKLRQEIFEFRHQVFVKSLNWDVTNYESMEFDEYDALLPIYMVNRGPKGNLRAVWRLLPTTGPYMLLNTFSEFLGNKKAPRSTATWEISRFAFDPKHFGAKNILEFSKICGEMFCALGEFGFESGIKEVIAVFDSRFFLILKNLGVRPTWMGQPKQFGDSVVVAASFEVSPHALQKIRQKTSLFDSVLTQNNTERKAA